VDVSPRCVGVDSPGQPLRWHRLGRSPDSLSTCRNWLRQGDREWESTPQSSETGPGSDLGEQHVRVEAGPGAGVAGGAHLVDDDEQGVAVAVEADLANVLDVA
jgi:hypothetical protein